MQNVREQLLLIFAVQAGLTSDRITDSTRFHEDMALDSIDYPEISSEIQRTLKVEVENDDFVRTKNFGGIVTLVESRITNSTK